MTGKSGKVFRYFSSKFYYKLTRNSPSLAALSLQDIAQEFVQLHPEFLSQIAPFSNEPLLMFPRRLGFLLENSKIKDFNDSQFCG